MDYKKQNTNQFVKDTSDKYYRTYEDSPIFRLTPGVLTTGASQVFDLEQEIPTSTKFLPLTNINIINNSTETIYLFINGNSNASVIAGGTNVTFDRASLGGGVRSLKIQNGSSTSTSANEIEINLWKEGIVIDQAFQKMHKAFYKFLFRN